MGISIFTLCFAGYTDPLAAIEALKEGHFDILVLDFLLESIHGDDVVPLVRYHHERIDGRGYTDGLKGDEIPFLARILAVADAFDAMSSDRLYRTRLNVDEARNQLVMDAGSQFDADIVEKFIELLDIKFDKMQNNIATTYKSLTSEVCGGYDVYKKSLVNK